MNSTCKNFSFVISAAVSTSILLCYRNGVKFFLAGEMTKALPMSPKRVRSIAVSTLDTTVELVGTPGELVQFDICDVADVVLSWSSQGWPGGVNCRTVNCMMTGGGTATLSTLHSTCC